MALSFKDFCSYARIAPDVYGDDAEGAVAELCLQAAIEHARASGIPVDELNECGSPKLELYIYALALHFYDNRGFTPNAPSYAADEYMTRLMTKMRIELTAEGASYGI